MYKPTIAQIKKVRSSTEASLADCRKALTETNGDIDKAIILARTFADNRAQADGDIRQSRNDYFAEEKEFLDGLAKSFQVDSNIVQRCFAENYQDWADSPFDQSKVPLRR